jgi:hypothetical protein
VLCFALIVGRPERMTVDHQRGRFVAVDVESLGAFLAVLDLCVPAAVLEVAAVFLESTAVRVRPDRPLSTMSMTTCGAPKYSRRRARSPTVPAEMLVPTLGCGSMR